MRISESAKNGFSRVFFGKTMNSSPIHYNTGFKKDLGSLKKDWERVGNDIGQAIKKYHTTTSS